MPNDFDGSARNYDETFSFSEIGKAQRDRVHHYLNKYILKETKVKKLNILEINCGTGEDANFFYQHGHRVLATDISEMMIEEAKKKYSETSIGFQILDIKELDSIHFGERFDLIFSNFGGLNCIDKKDLERFFEISKDLLNPSGKMALVIMPKKCLWERFYFMVKGDFKSAFRRNNKDFIMSNVDGVKVPTWYFSPKEIVQISRDFFKALAIKPVGICIPPSYLEHYFRNKKFLLNWFFGLERIFSQRFWSNYADHFIIILQRK
jgi:cyclopropane fatty-acyl-phospholipid synthase-like methyltransferase